MHFSRNVRWTFRSVDILCILPSIFFSFACHFKLSACIICIPYTQRSNNFNFGILHRATGLHIFRFWWIFFFSPSWWTFVRGLCPDLQYTLQRCNWIGVKVNAHRNVSFLLFLLALVERTHAVFSAAILHFLPKRRERTKKSLTEIPKTFCLFSHFAFTLTSLSLSLFVKRKQTSRYSLTVGVSFFFYILFLAIFMKTERIEPTVLRAVVFILFVFGHTAIGHTFDDK